MKKEIGSEFWDIPVTERKNTLFPDSVRWFMAGRSALQAIVADAGIQSVSMPSWCCESMLSPFRSCGAEIHFYHDVPSAAYDAVFVMDYFGFTDQVQAPPGYTGVVIRDLTHSVFSKTYTDADYYFGSLRKWAGFKTGGFAFGRWKKAMAAAPCNEEYVRLRTEAMRQKAAYINGAAEEKTYLSVFHAAEDVLEQAGVYAGYAQDQYAAEHLDIDFIKEKRRENAKILIERIGCMFELKETDCPLFVPILTENRDALRQYLIDHNVYCPVHWPRSDLNERELSLVCDQRYDPEDMQYVCELIERFQRANQTER